MPGKLKESGIKQQTEEYWKRFMGDYDCYVNELLACELIYARDHPLEDGSSRLRQLDTPVHTLALTVGESFEPLLQVACVLRPRRVVLILNNFYGDTPGLDHGATLKKLMVRLSQMAGLPDEIRPSLLDDNFDLVELRADTPTEAFRALREAMQKREALPPEGYENAVDITGAKKSMVVGAFLYAAHSGLSITYVDFDEYNSDMGKPYGYTCKIGRILDPYEAFRLREWEQVRQQYNSYNFRNTRVLLGKPRDENGPGVGIMGAMTSILDEGKTGSSLYEQADIDKVVRLAEVVEMYEAWDSGDFGTAKRLADHLPKLAPPSSVAILGTNWPIVSGGNTQAWPTDIYADADKLSVYAYDELRRIERLISIYQDFRSAFLRAGGLSEVLVAARIVALIVDLSVKTKFLAALSVRTPGAEKMFKALLNPAGTPIELNGLGLRNAPKENVIADKPMEAWWSKTTHFCDESTGWSTFLDMRNVLTHRYVAVSEDLARDALKFTTANFEDFIASPFNTVNLNAQSATWQELCSLLHLDFLPPRLRE
ncbi:MAG: hypothetical protein IAE85_08415 [Anaerolinea sp.]|nr:hypothetical protein [Anaerolinea sp.]